MIFFYPNNLLILERMKSPEYCLFFVDQMVDFSIRMYKASKNKCVMDGCRNLWLK
jgi:hypothetical protein